MDKLILHTIDSYNNRDYNICCEDFADSVKLIEVCDFDKFAEKYPNRAAYLKNNIPEYFD